MISIDDGENPMNKRKRTSDQIQTSNATSFVEMARDFDSDIHTANLPVYRASTVLFETLDEAEARGCCVGTWASWELPIMAP